MGHAFDTEAARVICEDAEDELGIAIVSLDLAKLIRVAESHHLDSDRSRMTRIGWSLVRLSIDDSGRINVSFESHINLGPGSTIEPGTQRRQKLEDLTVQIAFDRLEWLDSAEKDHPTSQRLPAIYKPYMPVNEGVADKEKMRIVRKYRGLVGQARSSRIYEDAMF